MNWAHPHSTDGSQDSGHHAASSDGLVSPPLGLFTLLECLRMGVEASALLMASGLLASTPRGDGHLVLVLPGFATDDRATLFLRAFLAARGFDARSWDLGPNFDHHTVGAGGERIAQSIRKLREESGRRISLIGWSLGGVIAREAARRSPEAIRQVVTLGSAFAGDPRANSLRLLYELLCGSKVDSPATIERFAAGHHPLPVPSTAVYSKSDGIAAWKNCRALANNITENVEVHASHFGMVVNPAVFYIVADRLAQREGEWAPFDRSGIFSLLYPGEAAPN
jgi:pimeloyl-ACP methyl ester carboxylesterase